MAQQPPAGWHHDPFGRYERRHWDGNRWTEHVVTQGRQEVDPPGERKPVPTQSSAAPVADWYPDPTQRFELRFWDGAAWTVHVSTRGVAGTDQLVQTAIAPTPPWVAPHATAAPAISAVPQPGRPSRKIANQARRAGAGDIEAGNGTLFTEQVLIVNQTAKLVGSTLAYSIFDQRGRQLGTVNEVRRDLITKVSDHYRRRTDRTRAYRFQIVDLQGRLLLAMNRPEAGFWGHTPLVIEGPGATPIGQIVQESTGVGNAVVATARGLKDVVRGASFSDVANQVKSAAQEINIFGGARFQLEAQGVLLARIHSANYREWNFSILTPNGKEIAEVTKTWAGWVKERFSKADNYVVKMGEPLEEPLRSLVIASAIAIDFELKQGEQTRGSTLGGTRKYK